MIIKSIQILLFALFVYGALSCTERSENKTLLFSHSESHFGKNMHALDSIVIIKKEKGLLIRKYRGNGNYLEIDILKLNHGFAELRQRYYGYIENEYDKNKANQMPTDTLPIFTVNDTLFTYKSNRDFYPTTIDLSLGDAIYKIEKNGNTYISSKKSLIESSYEERYIYNEDFNIIKYIEKYKGSVFVYR